MSIMSTQEVPPPPHGAEAAPQEKALLVFTFNWMRTWFWEPGSVAFMVPRRKVKRWDEAAATKQTTRWVKQQHGCLWRKHPNHQNCFGNVLDNFKVFFSSLYFTVAMEKYNLLQTSIFLLFKQAKMVVTLFPQNKCSREMKTSSSFPLLEFSIWHSFTL